MNQILPFSEWTCYRGTYGTNIKDVEDGILVWRKADTRSLISMAYEHSANTCKSIIEYDRDWHALIQAHPYILSITVRCKAYGERDIWTASFVIV